MGHLAILTFGILHEAPDHPRIQGFLDRGGPIFDATTTVPGFLTLVAEKLGTEAPYSSFFSPTTHAGSAETLSLWTHLEPLFAFAYTGIHAEALTKRREWFAKPAWPTATLWWVAETYVPGWTEAYQRQAFLHAHGSTPYAFHFKQPFNEHGQAVTIDRAVVQTLRQSPA